MLKINDISMLWQYEEREQYFLWVHSSPITACLVISKRRKKIKWLISARWEENVRKCSHVRYRVESEWSSNRSLRQHWSFKIQLGGFKNSFWRILFLNFKVSCYSIMARSLPLFTVADSDRNLQCPDLELNSKFYVYILKFWNFRTIIKFLNPPKKLLH